MSKYCLKYHLTRVSILLNYFISRMKLYMQYYIKAVVTESLCWKGSYIHFLMPLRRRKGNVCREVRYLHNYCVGIKGWPQGFPFCAPLRM